MCTYYVLNAHPLFKEIILTCIFVKEQARKSSEDTHFTEYAPFEKVWAG